MFDLSNVVAIINIFLILLIFSLLQRIKFLSNFVCKLLANETEYIKKIEELRAEIKSLEAFTHLSSNPIYKSGENEITIKDTKGVQI